MLEEHNAIYVLLLMQDWPRNWLYSRQATADSVGESGLHWLTPLWTYRDTEVSFILKKRHGTAPFNHI